MKAPVFIRSLTENERNQINVGLQSFDAFVSRRCQILLASERGERAVAIARQLGCNDQTIRNIIHEFNRNGLSVLQKASSRPRRLHTVLLNEKPDALLALLHHSPRDFDKPTNLWTLNLVAQVSFEQGLTTKILTREGIRKILKRLDIDWKHINGGNSFN